MMHLRKAEQLPLMRRLLDVLLLSKLLLEFLRLANVLFLLLLLGFYLEGLEDVVE